MRERPGELADCILEMLGVDDASIDAQAAARMIAKFLIQHTK